MQVFQKQGFSKWAFKEGLGDDGVALAGVDEHQPRLW